MPDTKWTITPAAGGGKDGSDLSGFQIVSTGNGTFNIKDKNGTVKNKTPQTFALSFNDGSYDWTVTLTALGDSVSGTWGNNDPTPANDETGTWVASGSGTGDPKDDEALEVSAGARSGSTH